MQTGTKKQNKTVKKKRSTKSKGLGDTIAKVTKVTGIEKVVKFIAGEDCGCEERRIKLNKLFPRQKPECFTASEYELVKSAIESKKNTFTAEEAKQYTSIYNRIFNQRVECIPCSFKSTVWDSLQKVYKQYA